MLWLEQSIYMMVGIIYRFNAYQKQLKNMFSNNEHIELN